MVKKITRDPMFLAQKSVDATEADKQVSEQKYYCSGSRTISVCNDQSGDHKENRGFSDGGRLPFAGWSKTMHEI